MKLYIPFLSSLDYFSRKVQNSIFESYWLSFLYYVEMQKWHFEHKTFVLQLSNTIAAQDELCAQYLEFGRDFDLLIICNGVGEWDLDGRLFNCLEKILYVDFNQFAYIWL